MKTIRVLQAVPSLEIGGAERFVVQLSSALDPCRFQVQVVSLYGKRQTELETLLLSNGIPVKFLNKRRGFDIRMFGRLRREIRSFGANIVHTHLHALNYAIPSILERSAPWAVHTVHSIAHRERKRIGTVIPSLLFGRAVAVIAIAKEVQTSIRNVYGVESDLIPNGIPLQPPWSNHETRRAWRQREGYGNNDFLCVCVGRLESVKNHRLLLEAFAGVISRIGSFRLLLAGDGELRQELWKQAERLAISERVHFLGIRSDVSQLLRASDMYIFASDVEGSPLSIMEAMAAGLPIVGTAAGGVPEMVPSSAGILVPPGHREALTRAISQLLDDPELRARMGRAAALRASAFDITVSAAAYGRVYERLLCNGRIPYPPSAGPVELQEERA